MKSNYKRPALKPDTWAALDDYRAEGQSADGAIKELLKSAGVNIPDLESEVKA